MIHFLLLIDRRWANGRQVGFVASSHSQVVVPSFLEAQTKIVPLGGRRRIGVDAVQVFPKADVADLAGLRAPLQGAITAARTMDVAAPLPEGRKLDALVVDRRRLDLDGNLMVEVHPSPDVLPEARVIAKEHPGVAFRLATTEGRSSPLEEEESRGHPQVLRRGLRGLDRGHDHFESVRREVADLSEPFLHHPDEGGFRLLGLHSYGAGELLGKNSWTISRL
jgi:hypothetical protein